jgi:hypothetical protein|tara:strand:- start:8 stop:163 length:156 start_codon:yes stop_codon:yes gene_type:complete
VVVDMVETTQETQTQVVAQVVLEFLALAAVVVEQEIKDHQLVVVKVVAELL